MRNGGRSRATLVLEDGAAFQGWSFAGDGEVAGEVVFTTSMVGYQETITDPSYSGQILLFTYPLIGNYGVIPGDDESRKVQAAAVLVREYTPHPEQLGERAFPRSPARRVWCHRRRRHRYPRPYPAPQGQGCDAGCDLYLRS